MSPNHGDTDEGDEDDYMSMVIEEPTHKETFTQRKRREQREVSTSSPLPSPVSPPPLPVLARACMTITADLVTSQSRQKPAEKSPPKLNEPPKKQRAAKKPYQKAPSNQRTRASK
jgi:hypothetical protein